jgi:hypothetical protein
MIVAKTYIVSIFKLFLIKLIYMSKLLVVEVLLYFILFVISFTLILPIVK